MFKRDRYTVVENLITFMSVLSLKITADDWNNWEMTII